MRAFIVSLVVAFAMLSILIDNGGASPGVVTGLVAQFQRGEWISVINAQTDPTGLQIALRNTTVYEDRERDATLSHEPIKPGARVTVWYRSVGERRPVADKSRVFADDAR